MVVLEGMPMRKAQVLQVRPVPQVVPQVVVTSTAKAVDLGMLRLKITRAMLRQQAVVRLGSTGMGFRPGRPSLHPRRLTIVSRRAVQGSAENQVTPVYRAPGMR
jgi:hypothetical protein